LAAPSKEVVGVEERDEAHASCSPLVETLCVHPRGSALVKFWSSSRDERWLPVAKALRLERFGRRRWRSTARDGDGFRPNRTQEGDDEAGLRGVAAAGRLSYLVKDLIGRMAVAPFGASATDVLDSYREADTDASQLLFLLNYGHFSELMPEVRRGYYAVDAS